MRLKRNRTSCAVACANPPRLDVSLTAPPVQRVFDAQSHTSPRRRCFRGWLHHSVKVLAGFCLLAVSACRGAAPPATPGEVPAGFVAIAAPDTGSATAYCAGYTAVDWTPFLASDSATVHIGPAMRDRDPIESDSVVLPGGRLVSYDIGEFGGGVTWLPHDSKDSVRIWNENVMRLIPRGDSVFGVGGLAHLGTNSGNIVRFSPDQRGWRAERVLDLGSAPFAVQRIGHDSLLVLTTRNLQLVDLARRSHQVVHANPAWSLAYPSSVLRDRAGTFYVGLRYAVARVAVHKGGSREQWLVPASCPGFRVRGSIPDGSARCECLSPMQQRSVIERT
jgi:hypothetical protein